MKTTITEHERMQLMGLLTLADQYELKLDAIKAGIHDLLGVAAADKEAVLPSVDYITDAIFDRQYRRRRLVARAPQDHRRVTTRPREQGELTMASLIIDPQQPDIEAQIRDLEERSEAFRGDLLGTLDDARKLLVYLHAALEESVKRQSHYAKLLNTYDGGERLTFADADAWLARLAVASVPRGTSQTSQT